VTAYPIAGIEGIGPTFESKLKTTGIRTTRALLERAKTPRGRRQLAEESGIEESVILKWANMADLMRVRGVAEEYSELLEAAGVDTVKELKRRNAANLVVKMAEVNAGGKMVRVLPSEKRVLNWIAYAKLLKAKMTY